MKNSTKAKTTTAQHEAIRDMDRRFKQLAAKYPLIVAHCKMMGSYDYYVHEQLITAEDVDAPRNTVYFEDGDSPVSSSDYTTKIDVLVDLLKYL